MPHGNDRTSSLLSIPTVVMPESLITTTHMPIYCHQQLRASWTAIITWHSRDFLMRRHNTDKMAALHDSVTSFTPSADASLGVETLPFTSSGRFVRGVLLYCTNSFSFFMESHIHHVQSRALPRKHRRMCWNRTGSCYVNKTVMFHMCKWFRSKLLYTL